MELVLVLLVDLLAVLRKREKLNVKLQLKSATKNMIKEFKKLMLLMKLLPLMMMVALVKNLKQDFKNMVVLLNIRIEKLGAVGEMLSPVLYLELVV